jgi:hypothetical protein
VKQKISLWLQRYKKLLIFGIPVLLLLMLSAFIWFTASQTNEVTVAKEEPVVEEVPAEIPHLITGVMVERELANRRAVAVMVENSPAARPHVGLVSADIVFEAVSEGGITRFMPVYSTNYPEKVGPVRSARSYYLDYLSEYDAFYAHAGGSPTALARVREYGIKSYPHSADSYWREPRAGVASEHTLFVNAAKIFQFGQEKRGWPGAHDFASWPFKDPATTLGEEVGNAVINFSTANYNTLWVFEREGNVYRRQMAGRAHVDRISGEQITVRTVIAMTVQRQPNPPYPGTGRESEWSMATLGEGAAAIFQDGTKIDATWKKPSRTERTRFYDAEGKEITINRGRIWVAVVPQTGNYSYAPQAP